MKVQAAKSKMQLFHAQTKAKNQTDRTRLFFQFVRPKAGWRLT